MKAKYVVADTAVFVKNVPFWEYGEEIISMREVIAEIRDRQTRQRVEALPISITMRQPQPHSIRFVNEFSKKTGDYASLSHTDIKVLALTYELEVEARGSSGHLRTEPQKIVTEGVPKRNDPNKLSGVMEDTHPLEQEESSLVTVNGFSSTPREDGLTGTEYDPVEQCPQYHEEANKEKATRKISHQSLKGLNIFLSDHSYISGHIPTAIDIIVYGTLILEYPQFSSVHPESLHPTSKDYGGDLRTTGSPLMVEFPHVRRWATHLSSFSQEELNLFPSAMQDLSEFLLSFTERYSTEEGEVSCLEDLRPETHTQEERDHAQSEECEGDQSEEHEHDQSEECEGDQSEEHEHDQSEECDSGPNVGRECDTEDHGVDTEDLGVECVTESDTNEDEQEDCDDEESGVGSSNEDDDDSWITPSNLKQHKIKSGLLPEEEEEEEKDVLVACMTSDFAIQNVLKHIGLSVMGVDGKLIRKLKTYILRCHACFKTTSVMTKIFCHHCGNKTLKKVSVTVDPDGSQRIWINTKRPISKRGMKYSLPTPKGGKHHRNPLLVVDQREAKHFSSKMSKKKVNPMDLDYDPDHMPFAVRDVYSRASQFGYMGGKEHHHYYWEKRNPNERSRRIGKKKN